MEKYFVQKEVDCECCGGKGQIYHTRACAEDDPSGWDACFHCLGTSKMQKLVDITAEIQQLKTEKADLYMFLAKLTSDFSHYWPSDYVSSALELLGFNQLEANK